MQVLRHNNIEKMSIAGSPSNPLPSTHHTQNTPHPRPAPPQQTQGLTALLVMIAVLCMLLAYCFWGAPWCRSFCRRRVCCFCPMDEPEGFDPSIPPVTSATPTPGGESVAAGTPTIILLPFGRMLVVDGAVFAQFQADSRGLDLMELGENIVRTQRMQTGGGGSMSSVLQVDSDSVNSKGISPMFESFPPPAYDVIFGSDSPWLPADLPPSYSEVSLQMRQLARERLHEDLPAIDDDVDEDFTESFV